MSGPWTLAVDFGTTSTVTAMGDDRGASEILEVDGNRKMPSMVVIDEDQTIVVGIAAGGLARSMPHRTIRTPKDRLGDAVPIVVGGTPYPPVAFVTAVLEHVLADATRFQGRPPTHSRLTYPATWNRPKRARLLEAAVKAGYPEPELVAEPIAAALTHAHVESLRVGDHVAVYDLGGGTFDTVVLLRTIEGFSVVGQPLGDPQLGGELFDEILMNYVGEQIDPALWDELLVSEDTDWMRAAARLRAECKRAKEALSSHPVAEVSVGLPGGLVDVTITRAQLDELIMPFVDESVELLQRCMADAGMDGDRIKAIYVTGGASRMPIVEQRVRDLHPNTIVSRKGDPKVAVALGALLAIPGSLDASLQRAPDRTTIDEVEDATEPVPTPPVVEVPPGPTTKLDPTAQSAPVPPVIGLPSAPPTHVDPPSGAAPAPAQPTSAPPQVAPQAVTASVEDDKLSPKIVVASIFAVLLLAGGVLAILWPRFSGDGADDPPVTVAVDDSTTTTTTEEPEVTEESRTTKSTEGVPSGPISAEEFAQIGFSVDEVGPLWQIDAIGVDPNRQINICSLDLPVASELEWHESFISGNGSEQVTSQLLLFADAAAAQQAIDFDKTLPDVCQTAVADRYNETSDLIANAVPATFSDRAIAFPDDVDDSAAIAYRFEVDTVPSLNQHVLVGQVRVERAIGSVRIHTGGEPTALHLDLVDRLLEITAQKLVEVQR